MMGRSFIQGICCILTCLALTIPAAHAQVEDGMLLFEIYGGNTDPQPDDLDDETTFGIRFGNMLTENVAIIVSLGRVEFDGTSIDGMSVLDFDSEHTLLDVTVGYVFRPASRFAIAVGGGIGGSFNSFDGELTTPTFRARFDGIASDSFTLHAVVGPVIGLGSRVYLKPVVKARWFEAREDDEIDLESSLAVGFRW